MNGEIVDSWICNLSTYFKTSREMEEDMKLHMEWLLKHSYFFVWYDVSKIG